MPQIQKRNRRTNNSHNDQNNSEWLDTEYLMRMHRLHSIYS